MESLSYEFYPPHRPNTSSLSTKQSKNAQEKRRAAKKRGKTKRHSYARSCASHHGPWWAARSVRGGLCPLRSRSFLNATFWYTFWASRFALDLPVLGLLDFLFNLSSLGLASTHLFLLKLGSNHANLQSQLNKAKTKRNRRNTCINRKLMQINPKFQA